MRKEGRKSLWIGLAFLCLFIAWTMMICRIQVRAIGPKETEVGFATLNQQIHQWTGVHMNLYVLTDWLGLVPICFVLAFGLLGLVQWIGRKSLWRVDRSILVLGVFYLAVFGIYFFFEMIPINYRPVLINGFLEVSYPSSTTMLVMCIIPTTVMQIQQRIKGESAKWWVSFFLMGFMLFMVIGRLVSGVHWFTDIVGSVFLSCGLVLLYDYCCKRIVD